MTDRTLVLNRIADTPYGTFGNLRGDGLSLWTIEDSWAENRNNVSCIPLGRYVVARTVTPHHGNTFEVLSVPNRTAVLIHSGNTHFDTEGCILPGLRLGIVNDLWAVKDSALAYEKLDEWVGDDERFRLYINWHNPYKR